MKTVDFDLKENIEMAGGLRLYAEILFGDGKEESPKLSDDGAKTARTLMCSAAARLERTTRHLELWIKQHVERNTPKPLTKDDRIPGLGSCPVCKTDLCTDDADLHYCPTCGQAVKGWTTNEQN